MKKRINQMTLLLAVCISALAFQSCKDKPKETEANATLTKTDMSANQLNMSTKQIYTIELEYEFKDYVTIDLTFASDTALYWIERTSGTDADEKIKTIHLNEHTTLTGWIEHDKTIVSLYSDFARGKTYGYQYFSDGTMRKLIGTIKLKSKD